MHPARGPGGSPDPGPPQQHILEGESPPPAGRARPTSRPPSRTSAPPTSRKRSTTPITGARTVTGSSALIRGELRDPQATAWAEGNDDDYTGEEMLIDTHSAKVLEEDQTERSIRGQINIVKYELTIRLTVQFDPLGQSRD